MTRPDSSWHEPTSLISEADALARLQALSDQTPGSIPSLVGLPKISGWLSDAQAVLPDQPDAAKAAEWLKIGRAPV